MNKEENSSDVSIRSRKPKLTKNISKSLKSVLARIKKHPDIYAFFLLLLIGFILRYSLLSYNSIEIGYDESVFLSGAYLVSKSKTIYIDVFDHKTPLLIWFYSLMIRIFGTNFFIMRLISSFIFFITAYFVYLSIKKLFTTKWAIFGSLLFLFWYSLPSMEQLYIMQESPMVLFLVLWFYTLLNTNRSVNRIKLYFLKFLNGVFFSLSFLCKQPAIIMIVVYLLVFFREFKKSRTNQFFELKEFLISMSMYILGILIIPMIIVIYSLIKGFFFEMVIAVFGSNLKGSYHSIFDKYLRFTNYIWPFSSIIIGFSIPYMLYSIYKRKDEYIILNYWIISFILFVLFSPAFYPHYFYQISFPLVVMVCGTLKLLTDSEIIEFKIDNFIKTNRSIVYRNMNKIWGISFIIAFIIPMLPVYKDIYFTERAESKFQNEMFQICGYIKNNTEESDLISAFPRFPSVYFLCERLNLNRFIYFSWIVWEIVTDKEIVQIIDDMKNTRFIVSYISNREIESYVSSYPKSQIIFNFITENLTVVHSLDLLALYTLE